uniref:Uncharacterized protein n=1 Tax=viral metagenome TaxID=1070528 RepID=A0A6C0M004_9ZZZZ
MEDPISFVYCDKCQSSINPTSAFVRLSESHKRNTQQLKLDHARELQSTKTQREEECELLRRKVEQYESRVRGEERLHESLITDYEAKILTISRDLSTEKERVAELQDVEETIKDLQLSVDHMQMINKNNVAEIEDMKQHEDELAADITRLTNELAARGDAERLKEENEQLVSALAEKDVEIANIKDTRKAMEDRASFYMNERDQFRDTLAAKIKEADELSARLNVSLLEVERLTADLTKRVASSVESPKDWSEMRVEIEKQKRLIETRLKLSFERDREETLNQVKTEYERRIRDIHNGYKKNMYQIGIPLDQEFIATNVGKLTSDHLKDGAQGLSRFIETIMSNSDTRANYVCVDMDDLKFKYLDKKGRWNTDKGCVYLKSILYPSIGEKCTQILSDLKNMSPRDDVLIGAVMNTVAKVETRDKSFHEDLVRYLAPLVSKH